MSTSNRSLLRLAQEYSIPLLAGVLAALVAANLDPSGYRALVGWEPIGGLSILGHPLTLQFLVNDVFMALFFGLAAKEITAAALPGGSLSPLRNAINPLFATAGGVLGPVAVFFALLAVLHGAGAFPLEIPWSLLKQGWGIPTATDIALAWLVARTVFGKGHPAIDFLLLLAVADDAIGLAIIAVFYGDPAHPARPAFLGLVLLGMAVAYALRRADVRAWWLYVLAAGPISWCGLVLAHLHPALALVPIVPFLPGPRRASGLFDEPAEVGGRIAAAGAHSPLDAFEHRLKLGVDLGLFFFALANAGVEFSAIGPMTWTVLAALVIGKTAGISLFAWVATRLGFPLPFGMSRRDLVMAAFIAALGLTVALFVAGAAFVDPLLAGQAKMGALLSGLVGVAAVIAGRALGFGRSAGARRA